MKKLGCTLFIAGLMFATACGANPSADEQIEAATKQCKIEVFSAQDDSLLTTIDDEDAVSQFTIKDQWEMVDDLPDDLVPQYQLIVYQQKTLLAGEDPDKEREYEAIEYLTTYQDTSYIEEQISPDVVKNIKVPQEFLTQYYLAPDETIGNLEQLL